MLEVYNNQEVIAIAGDVLEKFEALGRLALPMALENPSHGGGVLPDLELVEVSIVDDPTIDQVHRDFMDIPGATDVITFAHGEIVVSVETAKSYAAEYGHSMERELMLYIIHGLLHLSGHEDAAADERATMEGIQGAMLDRLWPRDA
ncbi:rRNA maturation RNase YbeY [Rubritalea marina]|uniref:rRNA maturation RNase YbeY n=1 Tax=Rubritalea marina TaxID=361055 RepID=UPI0006863EB6|nr:rRNA maturation RNase YbeY [Rubritalea marina]